LLEMKKLRRGEKTVAVMAFVVVFGGYFRLE
jgi:hypothetical protein